MPRMTLKERLSAKRAAATLSITLDAPTASDVDKQALKGSVVSVVPHDVYPSIIPPDAPSVTPPPVVLLPDGTAADWVSRLQVMENRQGALVARQKELEAEVAGLKALVGGSDRYIGQKDGLTTDVSDTKGTP